MTDAGMRGGPGLRWLRAGRPGVVWAAVVLGCLLCVPSLFIGLIADDITQGNFLLAHARWPNAPGHFWDLFYVCGRMGPDEVRWGIFNGTLPWWASPHLKLAFFRPLAAGSQYLDYLLFPNAPWLMHLHNIVWYGAIVLLAALLYRRVLGAGATSGLALLLYTIDEAHTDGTAWIAARNTLMTAAFVLLALLLFERARRDGSRVAAWLAPLALLLGLASSEGALAAWGYLVAYALCLDRGSARARVLSLLPAAVVTLGWVTLGHALGYGVKGSGLYVDPRTSPLLFLRMSATRLPELLAAQIGPPLQLAMQLTHRAHVALRHVIEAASLSLLALALWLAWPRLRRRPQAAFFALGMLGSALPICAGTISPRLLFLVGFGAHGLLAELAAAAFARVELGARLRRRLQRAVVGALLLVNGPLALAAAPLTPLAWLTIDQMVRKADASLPPPRHEPTAVMVLNSTAYVVAMFVVVYRLAKIDPGVQVVHVLGTSEKPVRLRRPDRNAIVLEPEGGYLREHTSLLMRRPEERFKPGDFFTLTGFWVVVEDVTRDGRPARIRIKMVDGEDPHFAWVTWDDAHQRFEHVTLPPVGGTLTLPGTTTDLQPLP